MDTRPCVRSSHFHSISTLGLSNPDDSQLDKNSLTRSISSYEHDTQPDNQRIVEWSAKAKEWYWPRKTM